MRLRSIRVRCISGAAGRDSDTAAADPRPATPAALGVKGGLPLALSTSSSRTRTSIAPVESLGLTVPAGRSATLPGDAHHVLAAQPPRRFDQLADRSPGWPRPESCHTDREGRRRRLRHDRACCPPSRKGHVWSTSSAVNSPQLCVRNTRAILDFVLKKVASPILGHRHENHSQILHFRRCPPACKGSCPGAQ